MYCKTWCKNIRRSTLSLILPFVLCNSTLIYCLHLASFHVFFNVFFIIPQKGSYE
jgi:hypothetical protein